jgi:hypothetical protein
MGMKLLKFYFATSVTPVLVLVLDFEFLKAATPMYM